MVVGQNFMNISANIIFFLTSNMVYRKIKSPFVHKADVLGCFNNDIRVIVYLDYTLIQWGKTYIT